ncbi:hypothetical protein PVT67_12950 [Gallaecimonas kandeliae]|uniref:DUF6942 family protein n=1 Tax=Gallaecimonas kandeliae TaxID=3029055 RepID=UPI00264821DC|nr:hypothetical protein [Gallaecimonas kandeliae]WKE64571.1 hypothetical protein PVT67_12950 [Gallaecimonas kandeliae]
MQTTGFGDPGFRLAVYVAKGPNMAEYRALNGVRALVSGEIDHINSHCGNGWRKLFNVYAKLLYALPAEHFPQRRLEASWQQYRDRHLLQADSGTALLLSPPDLAKPGLHVIAGRTHAKALLANGELAAQLQWLDEEFAVDTEQRLLVCPYFDYRQLSNQKIDRLSALVAQVMA